MADIVERLNAVARNEVPFGLGNITTIDAAIAHIEAQDRRIAELEAALGEIVKKGRTTGYGRAALASIAAAAIRALIPREEGSDG